jgi:translation initiation factor 1
MKLTDLSQLNSLLKPEEKSALEKEHAERAKKRKIGEGHSVEVYEDRKARRGKAVTIVAGLALSTEMRDKLARELKQRLSAGGTAIQDTIEIQGEHTQRVRQYLEEQGFRVRVRT